MNKTLFVLLLIVVFMTAGCSSVQQPTQITVSTSVPTEEGTAPKYQFELLTEDEKEKMYYLMDLYPEEDMVNTRQKFMDAMDDYLSKHDAEGTLPSPYHYFLMFLTYTQRGIHTGEVPWGDVTVTYTTDLPAQACGSCPFAMVVYDEQIDDSPAEGYVLYRGENHTYAGKNGNVLHLYDFTIISDDPNTELTASLMSA